MKRLTGHAIALGKDDAWALNFSGWALAYVARDLQVGSSLIDRALAINSNFADAWGRGGWIKNWLGEPQAALERFEHAMRLSPLDPHFAQVKAGAAHCYFFLGRYAEAASWADQASQDVPDNQAALRIAAASNAVAERTVEAHEAVARLRHLNPTLRVSNLRDVLGPYRRQEDLSRYEEALRLAGLPE